MKGHNVCKCHFSIDTGFKQTEHTIFSPRYFNGIKIVAVFTIFEETVPKLSVNFGNHSLQDFHKNPISPPGLELSMFCVLSWSQHNQQF